MGVAENLGVIMLESLFFFLQEKRNHYTDEVQNSQEEQKKRTFKNSMVLCINR